MVYYPLSILMSASIRNILIITNEKDADNFKRCLGDGSQYGINTSYHLHYVHRSLPDDFIIAQKRIGNDEVVLLLGDNIFYGNSLKSSMLEASSSNKPAVIFGYRVSDPERFGVIEFDKKFNVISLEEKPQQPKSNYAAIGLYFYKGDVCSKAKTLKPSKRGELEITDLNNIYLNDNDLSVILLKNDVKWVDAGTSESILEASNFIHEEEKRIRKKILCPETMACEMGFVSKEKMIEWVKNKTNSDYYNSILKELSVR